MLAVAILLSSSVVALEGERVRADVVGIGAVGIQAGVGVEIQVAVVRALHDADAERIVVGVRDLADDIHVCGLIVQYRDWADVGGDGGGIH